MPVFSVSITRTAVFGIDCDNMLQARAQARKALQKLGDQIEWIETVDEIYEVPEDCLVYSPEDDE